MALRNAGYFVEQFLEQRIPDMITGRTTLPAYLAFNLEDKKKKKAGGTGTKHKERVTAFIKSNGIEIDT